MRSEITSTKINVILFSIFCPYLHVLFNFPNSTRIKWGGGVGKLGRVVRVEWRVVHLFELGMGMGMGMGMGIGMVGDKLVRKRERERGGGAKLVRGGGGGKRGDGD